MKQKEKIFHISFIGLQTCFIIWFFINLDMLKENISIHIWTMPVLALLICADLHFALKFIEIKKSK